MKRILVLLLALAMVMALFVGCQKDSGADDAADATDDGDQTVDMSDSKSGDDDQEAGDGEEAGDDGEEVAEKVYANDTEVLNLDWWSGIGTDSVFESPYGDLQCLYPFMLFGTLVSMDPYNVTDTSPEGVIYDLASAMEVSEDGLLYTFTIRDGVVWTDGTPFTAEDVVFSYELQFKIAKSLYAANLGGVLEGAQDVIDGNADDVTGIWAEDNKVFFKLTNPWVDIVPFCFAGLRITPKHLLGDADPIQYQEYTEYWAKPVGTGPWMIDEVSFPNYFTMVQNPNWYGEPVNIQNVTFTSHVTGGIDATIADMIAGKLDFAYGNGVNDTTNANNILDNNSDVTLFIRPAVYQRMFVYNGNGSSDDRYNAVVQEKAFRQAVNLLLDKDAIASMYGEAATSVATSCPYESAWYNTDIPKWERDVEGAKALLDTIDWEKYDKAQAVRIGYYYTDQTTMDIMALIMQQFSEAGLRAEPFLFTGDLGEIIYNVKNWDIMYCAYNIANPIMIYDMLQSAKVYNKYMGESELRDAEFQPMFDAFKSEADPAARKQIANDIQAWAFDNQFQTPIYVLKRMTLVNTAKLEFDWQIFATDEGDNASLLWHTWNLLGE